MPAVEAQALVPADAPVDEKYQLTGEAARELERGHASWYGGQFHGRRTASGENYDKYALTAAHKTLPFGTIVRVRSLKLGREVDVRINDRGPFAPGRVIDVSQAAAEALGLMGAGVAEVSLNVADSLGDTQQPSRSRKKPLRRTAAKPADPYRH
ncbi:septal ring lytic transglycosylase RlpA family protein [Polaromonas sp. DSR2-3-2]|uniref:septal ring lytic transglycosylase RlpA family protein n=1 Tax=unclassified Polaromonas TaxID=2638319 RepID=UPI003CFAD1E3